MANAPLYDAIGATYTATRRTDPRLAARVWAALGDARTVLNVGAGTGSYEPPDRDVTAVEPSAVMRALRPAGAAPCVAATAEDLPFDDGSFDAAMAFSTVHHWPDPIAGLLELKRVARRVVVFQFDLREDTWRRRFWLSRDYLPEVAVFQEGRPSLAEQAHAIGARIEAVLIPGTAPTASSRRTGDARRPTSTSGSGEASRCSPRSAGTSSSASCGAWAPISTRACGPSGTASSSSSTRPSSVPGF